MSPSSLGLAGPAELVRSSGKNHRPTVETGLWGWWGAGVKLPSFQQVWLLLCSPPRVLGVRPDMYVNMCNAHTSTYLLEPHFPASAPATPSAHLPHPIVALCPRAPGQTTPPCVHSPRAVGVGTLGPERLRAWPKGTQVFSGHFALAAQPLAVAPLGAEGAL